MIESMGESKAKKQAKERDGWECRFCGVTNNQHKEDFDRGLHAHHIIKENDGGIDHPKNLITVCRECHSTLERTQADALSRIKKRHTEDVRQSYEERIEELENDLMRERNENNRGTTVYSWLESSNLRVHILLCGGLSPEVKTFQDRSRASEAYAEAEGNAKLMTVNFDASEVVGDNLRYTSTDDVKIKYNTTSLSAIDGGFAVDADGFGTYNMPDELTERYDE